VNNTSGKGNNGTISGATWTSSGRYGKALVFDGVNNWVTVNDAASLDLTTGMTLEAWVYPTALGGGSTNGWRCVILKQQSSQLVYALYANSDNNRPSGYVYTSSDLGVSGNAQLPLNTWTHLASTYDGAMLRLYANGSQVGSRSLTGSINTSSYPLRIGGNSVWGEFFAGRIDEVRIYNRALSVAEIQGDMNKALGAVTGGVLTVQNQSVPLKLGDVGSVLSKSTPSLDNAKQQTANGSSTSSTSTTITVTSELRTLDHVEVGELEIDHQWKRVDLSKSFSDPVVLAKAMSYRDATPAVVEIRQTDATGFELRLQPWNNGSPPHATEAVGYLVIERGRFRLADDTSLESGTVDIDPAYPVHSIGFSQPFRGVPVVMTALANIQESVPVTGRPMLVNKEGFQFQLQPQGFSHSLGVLQRVVYVAWELLAGTLDGLSFDVNRTEGVTGGQFSTLTFKEIFVGAPVLLADIQSSQGDTPINVRWEHKDLGGVDLKIDHASDLNADGATPQNSNVVGYIVIR
jgi:hypothetical protein